MKWVYFEKAEPELQDMLKIPKEDQISNRFTEKGMPPFKILGNISSPRCVSV